MSDPVDRAEIEDVLSSIRRLVSTDAGDRPATEADDRLMLTPALRVDEIEATPGRADALRARVAELEEVVSRQRDRWDPDGVADDDNSAVPMSSPVWDDNAGTDAPSEAEAPLNLTGFAQATVEETGEPPERQDTPDEDALRDMVADIVRQELQGALGERITRNVRKLVRREIHRALDGQELE